MLQIFQAESSAQVATARTLMMEYGKTLSFNLCFQSFDEEMAQLPGFYAPPAGRLLLATWNDEYAGVIAMRPLKNDAAACEMKRLYVRPGFRGHAIGRLLVTALIRQAKESGYGRMVLDTVRGQMDHAIALYREFGFREIPPYYLSPVKEAVYLELSLKDSAATRISS
jgi:ribosomal protein S18 acetylase RimI-like enzyme